MTADSSESDYTEPMSVTSCTRAGCERPQHARTLCKTHYENTRTRNPESLPDAIRPIPPEQRFWQKVDRSGDCWEWVGSRRNGYGQFGYAAGDIRYAHRVAYELLVGPVPHGMQLDHLCRNRGCCNPGHLEVVTPGENYRRGVGFGGVNHRKRSCPKGHPYDAANTYVDAKGSRHCRACRRDRARARRAQ